MNDTEKLLKMAEDTLCEYSESAERLDAKRELLRQLQTLARNVHREAAPGVAPFVSYSRPKYVPKWLKRDEGGNCGSSRDTIGCSSESSSPRLGNNTHPLGDSNPQVMKTRYPDKDTARDTARKTVGDTKIETGPEITIDTTGNDENPSSTLSFTDKQLRDRQLLKRFTGAQLKKPPVELSAGWYRPVSLKAGPLAPATRVMNRLSPVEEPKLDLPVIQRELRCRTVRVRESRRCLGYKG
ncbi:YALI0A11847p [Yarrowia lipolytica CLIB122]|uniref:YALI0A11847p n=1 Tax=Yarrowia lipolytica (strain CLIB 122 / E 150) TaxID=284591 RepID=Q6CH68_YARLI|nr:YALI0A11847p [Yarrowia lipolytica CLIB122]CAG83923.1 YALI0A11847p [Yarrowia lipolytica CLIB122]|eukprot:XP_499994.1 YALI0A11847p [Yarrowia lipolytica CLIB122]